MKNIKAFVNELAAYINEHIVGTENTHIRKCKVPDMVRNRGQVISRNFSQKINIRKSITPSSSFTKNIKPAYL